MFCEKCGNPINEGAKFCRVCGNKADAVDVEKTVVIPQGKVTEEPVAEIGTSKVEEPVVEALGESEKESEPTAKKNVTPAKIATLCALSAPIVVILNYAINSIIESVYSGFWSPLHDLLSEVFDYEAAYNLMNVISDVSFSFSALLCLVVTIGVYLLFTFKHREKLPLFLCLIPVGEYIITNPIYNLFAYPLIIKIISLFRFGDGFFSDFLWYSLQDVLFIPFLLINAVIAYLIFRGVMKKILKNSAIAEERKTE